MEVTGDFGEFFASCNKHSVQYLIVRGYAFALHAHPRFTGDMDVFVAPTDINARQIIQALSDFDLPLSPLTWEALASPGDDLGQVVYLHERRREIIPGEFVA